MALSAGTKRTVACLLVGLGALLIVAALLIPTYTIGKLAKTPLDLEITTIATNQPNEESQVLDAKSLTAPEGSAKIDDNVPLVSQRFLTVEDPSDADEMTVQAGTTLRRTDKQGDTGILTANIDRVTISRKTGEPTDANPNGSIATSVDKNLKPVAEPVQHEGVQYRFPIDTEQKNYPYFDVNARKTFDMNFVEETEINSTKVYHFQQQVPATDLSVAAPSATNKLSLPAEKWGVEGGEEPVTMSRWYTNTRDVWVEPKTGTIVKGGEQLHMYYARSGDKPEVTALKSHLVFNEETVESQLDVAKKYTDELSLYGRVLPIILGILGLIALVAGVLFGLRGQNAQTASGQDGDEPKTARGTVVKKGKPVSGKHDADNVQNPPADDAPTQQFRLPKDPKNQ